MTQRGSVLLTFISTWRERAGELTGKRRSAPIECGDSMAAPAKRLKARWIFHCENVDLNRNCRFRWGDTRRYVCSKMFRLCEHTWSTHKLRTEWTESGLIWWWRTWIVYDVRTRNKTSFTFTKQEQCARFTMLQTSFCSRSIAQCSCFWLGSKTKIGSTKSLA